MTSVSEETVLPAPSSTSPPPPASPSSSPPPPAPASLLFLLPPHPPPHAAPRPDRPPIFKYSDARSDIASQTPIDFFTDFRYASPTGDGQSPPLTGSGSVLFSQYKGNIQYYLDRMDPHSLSEYREELFNRVRQQSIFQAKVFGYTSPDYSTLPANSFASFTISLYLAIFEERFVFSSSAPGFEIVGNLDEEIIGLLSYIDQQILPPQLLEQLRKLNVVWYDGGLICEITDQRGHTDRPIRVHLRVNPDDVQAGGFEFEQEFLFARYPLICLDPSPQVAKVARVAAREKDKWKTGRHPSEDPAAFMQKGYPGLFIGEVEDKPARERPKGSVPIDNLLDQLLRKIGVPG